MRFVDWTALCSVIVAGACAKGTDPGKNDANRPAVVRAPPVVLPSDTAHPDTMADHRDRMEKLMQRLASWHGLVGATAVMGDPKTLAQFYAADATFKLGDNTYNGSIRIANALVDLARKNSFKEFVRAPRVVNATDSVAVDSGSYGILTQREGGKSTEQRGTYVSTWKRMPGGDPDWVIRRDILTPSLTSKKR